MSCCPLHHFGSVFTSLSSTKQHQGWLQPPSDGIPQLQSHSDGRPCWKGFVKVPHVVGRKTKSRSDQMKNTQKGVVVVKMQWLFFNGFIFASTRKRHFRRLGFLEKWVPKRKILKRHPCVCVNLIKKYLSLLVLPVCSRAPCEVLCSALLLMMSQHHLRCTYNLRPSSCWQINW